MPPVPRDPSPPAGLRVSLPVPRVPTDERECGLKGVCAVAAGTHKIQSVVWFEIKECWLEELHPMEGEPSYTNYSPACPAENFSLT